MIIPVLIFYFVFQIRLLAEVVRRVDTGNPELQCYANKIPEIIAKSIAKNTSKTYAQGLRNWKKWSAKFNGIYKFPVEEIHLACFITAAIQSNEKLGKIEHTCNGLSWIHNSSNLPNPCNSETVRLLREAARRLLSKPVTKKEPDISND